MGFMYSILGWRSNSFVPEKISLNFLFFTGCTNFGRENIVHNLYDYQSVAAVAWKTMLKEKLRAHSAHSGGTHIKPAPQRWR